MVSFAIFKSVVVFIHMIRTLLLIYQHIPTSTVLKWREHPFLSLHMLSIYLTWNISEKILTFWSVHEQFFAEWIMPFKKRKKEQQIKKNNKKKPKQQNKKIKQKQNKTKNKTKQNKTKQTKILYYLTNWMNENIHSHNHQTLSLWLTRYTNKTKQHNMYPAIDVQFDYILIFSFHKQHLKELKAKTS